MGIGKRRGRLAGGDGKKSVVERRLSPKTVKRMAWCVLCRRLCWFRGRKCSRCGLIQ